VRRRSVARTVSTTSRGRGSPLPSLAVTARVTGHCGDCCEHDVVPSHAPVCCAIPERQAEARMWREKCAIPTPFTFETDKRVQVKSAAPPRPRVIATLVVDVGGGKVRRVLVLVLLLYSCCCGV
jgi:hypothetical protein